MSNIEQTVAGLGRSAAECEFWAAQSETPYWDKADLTRRAKAYRQEQFRIIEQEQLELAQPAILPTNTAAIDFLTGVAAIAGLILVAEIVLAIF